MTRAETQYRMREIRKQADYQKQRLLNIVSGTRNMELDYEQYKTILERRRSQNFSVPVRVSSDLDSQN